MGVLRGRLKAVRKLFLRPRTGEGKQRHGTACKMAVQSKPYVVILVSRAK